MVKTLERDRYALCEKHVIVPFCCSHQMYRYLAGCFGLISCRHYLEIPDIFREWRQWMEIGGQLQQKDFAEASEMQDYTKGLEAAEAAILFSEGEMDSTGLYTPGQVYEVDAEAAEFDPELAELGDELNSWIQQGERMSCAVAGQTMVVNQLENGYYSEGEFLEIAKANRWYDEGTYSQDVGKIAAYKGMDVVQIQGVPAEELKIANEEGVKVLAEVDGTLLHYPESAKRCAPDHIVQVLRVESRAEGEYVIINDPGAANGRGAVYPLEVFERAFRGNITKIEKGEPA